MTKKMTIIFSLALIVLTSPLCGNGELREECMPGKSLEELIAMRDEQLEKIKLTPECQKKELRWRELGNAQFKHGLAHSKCRIYEEGGMRGWMFGTAEDCAAVEGLRMALKGAQNAFLYAQTRSINQNKEFATLLECIEERKYEALEIPKS